MDQPLRFSSNKKLQMILFYMKRLRPLQEHAPNPVQVFPQGSPGKWALGRHPPVGFRFEKKAHKDRTLLGKQIFDAPGKIIGPMK